MLDPLPLPPLFLQRLSQPLADYLSFPTLPLHIHEVLLAFAFYHCINKYFAPLLSRAIFPTIYTNLAPKTRINWDVHVVSLVQSSLINVLALWVMFADEERWAMDQRERVWAYTGASGMIQGFAAGYFLWDLMVSIQNVHIFGWGLLAHAISALIVFSFGFRPFLNFYGPTFILYELSSPFLNFHWFFDKLNMTGSRPQLYNGIALLATFFCCRLVWGSYQSVRVYQDVWAAIQSPTAANNSIRLEPEILSNISTVSATKSEALGEMMRFAGSEIVPTWLAITYLVTNVLLNTLNFYWFGKMIETVRKRFQPPKDNAGRRKAEQKAGSPSLKNTPDREPNGSISSNLENKSVRSRRA
ncbi:MAG: hypothetical protein M1829_004453 [Trizodia sp. TS-e1964]|nr:MAG: hypothetical protein M1829_004453 [Trizodia sp. TS-e1964]